MDPSWWGENYINRFTCGRELPHFEAKKAKPAFKQKGTSFTTLLVVNLVKEREQSNNSLNGKDTLLLLRRAHTPSNRPLWIPPI